MRYAGTWHMADADGAPLDVRVGLEGDIWLTGPGRFTPELADQLAARLRDAAARARTLTVPPALAAALQPTRHGGLTAAALARVLGDAIRAGILAPGAPLPDAAALNAACGTTFNQATAGRAGHLLAGLGLAEPAGTGYRAAPDAAERPAGNS